MYPQTRGALHAVLSGTRESNPAPVPDGHAVLAWDLPGCPTKRYTTAPLASLGAIVSSLPEESRSLYAMFALCNPCHVHLDLELAVGPAEAALSVESALRAVGSLVRFLATRLPDDFACLLGQGEREGGAECGVLLLSAGGLGRQAAPNKASFHAHVRGRRPFRNVGHAAVLVRAWYGARAATDDGELGLRRWVDTSVYDQNRCFRLARCHKAGKDATTALRPVVPAEAQELLRQAAIAGDEEVRDGLLALARTPQPGADDATRWSAGVEGPEAAGGAIVVPPPYPPVLVVGVGEGATRRWDVAAALARYDDPAVGWVVAPPLERGLSWRSASPRFRAALGNEPVAKGSVDTTGATVFWRPAPNFSDHFAPPLDGKEGPPPLWAAMARRRLYGAPMFLNECVAPAAPRRAWLDLDHLAEACAAAGDPAVTVASVVDAVVSAVRRAATERKRGRDEGDRPFRAIVTAGVRAGAAWVDSGCHVRFPDLVLADETEHRALVAVARAALPPALPRSLVDGNVAAIRSLGSDKPTVDRYRWVAVAAGRPVLVARRGCAPGPDGPVAWSTPPAVERGAPDPDDFALCSIHPSAPDACGGYRLSPGLLPLARAIPPAGGGAPGTGGEEGEVSQVLERVSAALARAPEGIAGARLVPRTVRQRGRTWTVLTERVPVCPHLPQGQRHRNPWPLLCRLDPSTGRVAVRCLNGQSDGLGHTDPATERRRGTANWVELGAPEPAAPPAVPLPPKGEQETAARFFRRFVGQQLAARLGTLRGWTVHQGPRLVATREDGTEVLVKLGPVRTSVQRLGRNAKNTPAWRRLFFADADAERFRFAVDVVLSAELGGDPVAPELGAALGRLVVPGRVALVVPLSEVEVAVEVEGRDGDGERCGCAWKWPRFVTLRFGELCKPGGKRCVGMCATDGRCFACGAPRLEFEVDSFGGKIVPVDHPPGGNPKTWARQNVLPLLAAAYGRVSSPPPKQGGA